MNEVEEEEVDDSPATCDKCDRIDVLRHCEFPHYTGWLCPDCEDVMRVEE